MKIENLKINKKLISLITAGAISLSLAGCSPKDNDNKNNNNTNSAIYQLYEGRLENDIDDNVVTENGLCNVKDLSVVSRSTKEVLDITKIQVLVKENDVNTLKSIDRDLTLFFSNDISAIYYEGKEISLNDYMIVDKNGMEVGTIRQLFVDNKEVEISQNGTAEITKISLEAVDSTIEKYSCKLTSRNVNYDSNDVLKALILVNLPTLANEVNSDVYNTLLIKAGNPDINELIGGYTRIINAFNNPYYGKNEGTNYRFFYEDNVPYESLTHLGDLVLDKTQKDIYENINDRLNKMSTMLDTYELDNEVVKLLEDIQNGIKDEGDYSLINNGTLLALSPRFADARGMIFMVCTEDDRCLTPESARAVKVIAPYTSEESEFSLYGYDLFTGIANTFEGKDNDKTLTLTK